MKRLIMLLMILNLPIIIAFANDYEDYEIHNIIQDKISESIEWIYLNKYNVSIRPREPIIVNDLDSIYISIYFYAGMYELRSDFNNIIENKLLFELKNIFTNRLIVITTHYPYSILLTNNINNEIGERQNIINKLQENTHGISIENIFQNSIYGYIYDKNFHSTLGTGSVINQSLYNNINQFLENISRYYGGENIINY